MSTVRVDGKGRIVLPQQERDQLGIKPGDEVMVVMRGHRLEVITMGEVFDALASVAIEEHRRRETVSLRDAAIHLGVELERDR